MTSSFSPGAAVAVTWSESGFSEPGVEDAIRSPAPSVTCGFDVKLFTTSVAASVMISMCCPFVSGVAGADSRVSLLRDRLCCGCVGCVGCFDGYGRGGLRHDLGRKGNDPAEGRRGDGHDHDAETGEEPDLLRDPHSYGE